MSGGGPHAAAGTSHSGSRPPPLPALPAAGPCIGPSPPWAPVESGVRAIRTSGPPTGNPTLDARFFYKFPLPDTWAPYKSPLNEWGPLPGHLGHLWIPPGCLGPLQFCTPQKPGSPLEHPPWTPGSPIDPPLAPTPGTPTHPPSPTGCLGSSQSPPADTLVPYASLTRTCVCASVSLMASGSLGSLPLLHASFIRAAAGPNGPGSRRRGRAKSKVQQMCGGS